MDAAQCIQGRLLHAKDILWLRAWIAAHPQWCRKEIARQLCMAWQWRDGKGRLKDFAARALLLKLAAEARIELPALRTRRERTWPRPANEPADWQEPAILVAALSALQPLSVEVVEPGTASHRRWSFYVSRYHYLGLRVVGENLGYLVRDRAGRDVGCLLFGAAAWRCAPRDRQLGWDGTERSAGLAQIANNTRFLILPWVRVPHLASHVLGMIARRIDADWRRKYAHGLRWLETFVERDRFRGTCYQAANWRCVGQTTGRSRQDRAKRLRVPVKAIYLYPLSGDRR